MIENQVDVELTLREVSNSSSENTSTLKKAFSYLGQAFKVLIGQTINSKPILGLPYHEKFKKHVEVMTSTVSSALPGGFTVVDHEDIDEKNIVKTIEGLSFLILCLTADFTSPNNPV